MISAVRSFVYRDCGGKVIARVDRIEPGWNGRAKEFMPYLADGAGGFRDRPGLEGTTLPLYHASEVRDAIAAREAVYFVEGEGKCDDLREEMLRAGSRAAATTIQGGASAPMRSEHIAPLAGARWVVVFADSDDVGRRAARSRSQRVADTYLECEVRLVDLYPDRSDGSDVADWFAEGHTLDELLKKVGVAPRIGRSPHEASPQVGSGYKSAPLPQFVRASTLLDGPAGTSIDYVIDGLLPRGGTAILVGRPKAGKSTLALDLALSVARGEAFLTRATVKGPVLYLALEGARGAWEGLVRRIGVTGEDEIYLCIDRAPETALPWLRDEITRYRPALVVIDTLQRLLRVRDGNDYATASNVTDAVIELARAVNAALLMIHHAGKARRSEAVDEVMGSTAWAAAVDTVLVMRRTERSRTLRSDQRIGDPLVETVLDVNPETRRIEAGASKAEADLDTVRRAIEDFLGENPDGSAVDEPMIMDNVEGRNSIKRTGLRELVASGRVLRRGAGKRGDPFLYENACTLVPSHASVQEYEKQKGTEILDRVIPYSRTAGFLSPRGNEIEKRNPKGSPLVAPTTSNSRIFAEIDALFNQDH